MTRPAISVNFHRQVTPPSIFCAHPSIAQLRLRRMTLSDPEWSFGNIFTAFQNGVERIVRSSLPSWVPHCRFEHTVGRQNSPRNKPRVRVHRLIGGIIVRPGMRVQLAVLMCATAALTGSAWSADSDGSGGKAPTGLWGGIDAGYGILKRSYSVSGDTNQGAFSLAISGGYAWDPRLLLGVELAGWTLQGSNLSDPSQGEGIETIFGIARYYPIAESPLSVKGGGGLVKYWNNAPGANGASGWGGVLGIGYDVYTKGSMHLAPVVEYSFGSFTGATSSLGIAQNQRYQAITFLFGITFR
jgi:hypothetical protein